MNLAELLRDTKTNLTLGLRLVSFRKTVATEFVFNTDQLLVLLVLDVILKIVLDYFSALPTPEFNPSALPIYCLGVVISFLIAYLLSKFWKKAELFLTLNIMFFSISPVISGLMFLDHYLAVNKENIGAFYFYWTVIFSIFNLAVLAYVCYLAAGRSKVFTIYAVISFGLTAFPLAYYAENQDFWHLAAEQPAEESNEWAAYEAMDAEKLMYSQADLLANELAKLKPQRDQRSDLFFIGFASYATEDVFSKEVAFAKQLLDSRFDTQGHSINLINHLATRDSHPLASATNLALTLKHIGATMDKEDDVLFLYLTSHGSADHKLTVSFWPLALNDLTPEKLRSMLDDAGIKWRVIIISACYSGGFIEALKSEDTLVATAAAADKTSFGCGTESEFTYFGEALFKDILPHENSIVTALQQVQTSIAAREQRENIEASQPQLFIGPSIASKLADFGAEIQHP